MNILHYSLMLLAALTAGCTTNRFYTPNTMQVPMLSGKNQATVTAAAGISGKYTGWEAQAIYSPLNHVGLMFNHSDIRYDGSVVLTDPISSFFFETPYTGRARLTEGGLGGYLQAGAHDEYLLSLFAGFGQGRTRTEYTPPQDPPTTETYNAEWRVQRWFVQPALGMQFKRLQVGTGLRFAWVNYLDGSINARVGPLEVDRFQRLENFSPAFFTEMVWTIGWRFRSLVLSLNSTAVVRGSNTLRDLDLASNYVNIGLGIDLHALRKKK